MASERITFKTPDFVTIAGDWNLPAGAKKAVLLLHMMPAARQSFEPLTAELNKAEFATLAIDLRGHGESTDMGGKKLDYKSFEDADHQNSRLDVDAALNFLKGKGFDENSISFVGASIGANLALDALHRYKETSKAVLLSAGLDYRGVKTEQAMKGLNPNQQVWLVAAQGDEYSAQSSDRLYQTKKEGTAMKIFKGADHGTNLFKSESALIPDIVKFLTD